MAGQTSPLASCLQELIHAATSFATALTNDDGAASTEWDRFHDVCHAQEALLKSMRRVHSLLDTSTDLLRRLTLHSQMLACLQWLGEFQVLACIPTHSEVSVQDLALITGVPEEQLGRIARLVAHSGFLVETPAGKVAHSPLSAQFVQQPAMLDAVMFLAEAMAPSALDMAATTRRSLEAPSAAGGSLPSRHVPQTESRPSIEARLAKSLQLQRQLEACLRYGFKTGGASVMDIMTHVDASGIDSVLDLEIEGQEVLSPSERGRLRTFFPAMRIESRPSPLGTSFPLRRSSTSGAPSANPSHIPLAGQASFDALPAAAPQPFSKDATAYLIRLPTPSPMHSRAAVAAAAREAIVALVGPLRANGNSRLFFSALVMPQRGQATLAHDDEEGVLLQDISLMQLANGRVSEQDEIVALWRGVGDAAGLLLAAGKFQLTSNSATVFEIRYQRYDSLHSQPPGPVM